MQQFWGHDENLMYYRNHVYPLMGVNWGSTADYILLSEGDTIDVAMFSNWDFYKEGGAFVAFDQDSYKATTKANLTFRTVQYATKSVADGGSEMFEPVTGMKVALYDEYWRSVAAPEVEEGNLYTLDTSELEPGTYYLMALDPHAGETGKTSRACKAPATAVVTVTNGEACKHEKTEVRDAKEATCGADGYTGDTWCTVCNQKIKTGETIPATGAYRCQSGRQMRRLRRGYGHGCPDAQGGLSRREQRRGQDRYGVPAQRPAGWTRLCTGRRSETELHQLLL